MKKVLIFFAFFSLGKLYAQNTTTHTIHRGETITSIANRYGVSELDIHNANPFLSNSPAYAGMKLTIPVPSDKKVTTALEQNDNLASVTTNQDRRSNSSAEGKKTLRQKAQEKAKAKVEQKARKIQSQTMESRLAEAAQWEAKRKYKKAQKIYRKLAQESNSANVHFLNGRCYYLNEKWKDAIRELSHISGRSGCTDDIKASAGILLASAKQKREEQLQRRRETWAAIGTAVALTAVAAVDAYAQNQVASSSSSNGSNYSGSQAGNLNYLLDPRFALMQAQQQQAEEQALQAKLMGAALAQAQQLQSAKEAQWRKDYEFIRQNNPNLTWEDYKAQCLAIEANANQMIRSTSSSNTISSSQNEQTTLKEESSSNSHECSLCHGSGKIIKDFNPAQFGVNDKKKYCSICNDYVLESSGHSHITCPNCRGKGYFTTN